MSENLKSKISIPDCSQSKTHPNRQPQIKAPAKSAMKSTPTEVMKKIGTKAARTPTQVLEFVGRFKWSLIFIISGIHIEFDFHLHLASI